MLGAALAQAESFARKATLEELNRKRKDDDDAGAPITAGLLAAQLADFAASVYALQTDIATGDTELAALLKATNLERATAARSHDALALAEQGTGQARLEALTDPLRAAIKRIEADHKACGRLLDRELEQQSAQLSAAVLAMREAAR